MGATCENLRSQHVANVQHLAVGLLSSALHSEAVLTAQRPELQPLIDHPHKVAQGRDDIRTESAGIIAGSWFAGVAQQGHELIAAGLLMLAGPVDLDELYRWVRVGSERRRGSTVHTGRPPSNSIRSGPTASHQ